MRLRVRFLRLSVALVLLGTTAPALVCAQTGGMQTMPALGTLATPTGQIASTTTPATIIDQAPALSIQDTYVSFIDSAVPRNLFGMRFEATYNNRQPMRAEYYHPKGGLPGRSGFPFAETRIDYQELTTYAEYSWTPWFSAFMEAPYRWLNPTINENRSGASDMRYGLKVCTWSSQDIIATILLRVYQPSASSESLGTGHWSIEPGLLMAYRFSPMIHFEGEFRYWVPIGGTDFAGNLIRYGAGVTYGPFQYSGAWFAPVVEGIGWTVLSGQTMIATAPDSFIVQDAWGQTIANAYLGLRFGYGAHLSFYAGYGRSLTGDSWQRDIYRFEMRFAY